MATLDESSTPAAFDPRALVAHHRFVRRLALGLAGDPDAADELTARTLAAAVAQRPDTGPGFRVWLGRVVRRLFLRERRERERRDRRERSAAPAEATRATVDVVAEIELQQQIARAFESLEGPSKSALFLRYFHDRTPAEIARELELPVATVKSRLQRGLQQLRERLDAAHRGGRGEWLASLLPWIGGPLVTTKVKVVPIAVAALLIAGATVGVNEVWKRIDRSAAPAALPAPERAAASAATTPDSDGATAEPPAVERTPVARDPAALPFASGVVVDESGAPLAGVAVVASLLRRSTFDESIEQEPLRFQRLERDRLAVTGVDGRFIVAEPAHDLAALEFVRTGFAVEEVADLSADRARNQELRVALRGGGKLRGRVVDTEHRPLPHAMVDVLPVAEPGASARERVAAHLPDAPRYLARSGFQRTVTDGDGAFSFTSLPPRPVGLSVMDGGYAWTQVAAGDVHDPCEVALPRSALLVDVTDGDTHEPIDASLVLLDAKSGEVLQQEVPWKPADVEHSVFMPKGRLALHTGFKLPGKATPQWMPYALERRAAVEIRILAEGYVGETRRVELSADEEPPHWQVALTPAIGSEREPSITGRVTGGGRNATLSVYGLIPNWSEEYLENRDALLKVECAADGSFELFDLPKGRYRLRADASGRAPAWSDVDAPASDVVLTLVKPAGLEVVVHDHAGAPAVGVAVHAQQRSGRHAWSTKTDATGVARFDRLPPGALRVGAFEKLFYDSSDERIVLAFDKDALPADGDVDLDAGETKQIDLLLVERVPFHLHFERDDGTTVLRAKLELMSFSGPVQAAAYRELGRLRPLALEIDSRGDAIAELFPGHYSFQVSESTATRGVELDVPRSGEGRTIVKLPVLGPTGVIVGRLADLVTHAPIAHRKVFAWSASEGAKHIELGLRLTDDEGRFRFAEVPAGRVNLNVYGGFLGSLDPSLQPDPQSPYGMAVRSSTIEAGKENEIEILLPPINGNASNLPTVDVDARVTDAATGLPIAKACVIVELKLGEASHELLHSQTDDEGRLTARIFAGESYSVDVFTAAVVRKGRDGSPSPYQSKKFEAAPKDGVLLLDVALARR
jgi:RNA polymerase sigma-70 factor (ECF subfamily)